MPEELLVDIDYTTVGDRAHVRLFSRGRSLIDKEFSPYFYVSADKPGVEDALASYGHVEKVKRRLLGVEKEVYKLTLSHPSEVPKIREEVRRIEGVREVYEDDILYTRRYLVDKNLIPLNYMDFKADGSFVKEIRSTDRSEEDLRVMSFDIETYNPKGAPRPKEDPVIMVSLASSTGVEKVLSTRGEAAGYVEILPDEAAMLKRFVEIVREEDVDVLVGYNSDQFDLPYMLDRAEVLGVELPLGRENISPKIRKGRGLLEAVVVGRPHVDLYPIVRRNVRLSSYVLENVVRDVLGIEKEKIPPELMWRYWDEGGDNLKRFMDYSREDAAVTLDLAEKFLPLYFQLVRIVGLPLQDIARMTAGQLVEWLLIREAHTKGELVPNRGGGREYIKRVEESYAGGYVMEPVKGLLENVVVFDFRSLYPSIIVTHNVDPTTLVDSKAESSPPELDVHFRTDAEGFIPSVLKRILERRVEEKEKMKKASDPLEKRMRNVAQNALKIVANSFYGYMGYPRARWYKKECAESVTSYARMYTKKVMAIAEEEYGFRVVYGDTDSLFMVMPPDKRDKAMSFMEDVNKRLPGTIELEYDGFYPRGLFVTKKRYALVDEKGNMVIKGLETVRRDWTKLSRDTQESVLSVLLKEGDPKKAAQIVKDNISRLKERKVSLEEITIYTQLTKSIGRYKNLGPHVKAAKKSIERGREVTPGLSIGYIIKTGKGLIGDRAEPVEDVSIEEYDIGYYIENQLLPPVARIMEVLGYSEESLKEEMVQGSLKKWF